VNTCTVLKNKVGDYRQVVGDPMDPAYKNTVDVDIAFICAVTFFNQILYSERVAPGVLLTHAEIALILNNNHVFIPMQCVFCVEHKHIAFCLNVLTKQLLNIPLWPVLLHQLYMFR
jgi:hypothetical protein